VIAIRAGLRVAFSRASCAVTPPQALERPAGDRSEGTHDEARAQRDADEHEHRPSADRRARDGDALLLAARELGRPVIAPILQPDGGDELLEPFAVGLATADPQRQGDVLLRGQDRQEVVGLKDEADLVPPQQGQLVIVEPVEPRPGDLDPSGGRLVEPREDVQERRLAGARRPHDRGEAAAQQRDVDAAQRVDGCRAFAEALGDGGRADDDVRARRMLQIVRIRSSAAGGSP
jgi:hypothetical protein